MVDFTFRAICVIVCARCVYLKVTQSHHPRKHAHNQTHTNEIHVRCDIRSSSSSNSNRRTNRTFSEGKDYRAHRQHQQFECFTKNFTHSFYFSREYFNRKSNSATLIWFLSSNFFFNTKKRINYQILNQPAKEAAEHHFHPTPSFGVVYESK